jgi:hypothetical protein
MSGTTNVGKIEVGMGEIFLDVVVPVTPPIALVGGVPTSGAFIGATLSPCMFNYRIRTLDIRIQQDTGIADAVIIEEDGGAEFEVAEFTYDTLKRVFMGAKDASTGITFGGNIITPKHSVCIVSQRRSVPGTYKVAMLYSALLGTDGVRLPFARESESKFPIRVTGTSFLSARPIGDRQGFVFPDVISA